MNVSKVECHFFKYRIKNNLKNNLKICIYTYAIMPYIYIVHCKQHINSHEKIFKIGRTSDVERRLKGYAKGSIIIYNIYVKNEKNFETCVLKKLSENFKQRLDCGREYFEGDVDKIIELIHSEFKNNKINQCYDLQNNNVDYINSDLLGKDIENIYLNFLKEKTSYSKDARIHCSKLYIVFKDWFKNKYLDTKIPSNKVFVNKLRNYAKVNKIYKDGNTQLGILHFVVK